MKKAIIIPLYIRLNDSRELPESEGLGLAKRAIRSLDILKEQDFTLVLPVCVDGIRDEDGEIVSEAARLLGREAAVFREGRTLVFGSIDLNNLRGYLKRRDFRNFYPLIGLLGYARIRNAGLLLAHAAQAEVAIFIDSDEVIEDPDFLGKACEFLQEEVDGKPLQGKGGFYVNSDGNILLPAGRPWWKLFWDKNRLMNRVWRKILSSRDRLTPAPILLGGNLILHRSLFHRVPFDPYIPRGEDTDYLINARKLGHSILFDKELRVRHLHPERSELYFEEELKGDIERFLYERNKTRRDPNMNLDPYPGYFLNWTLYPRAILSSVFFGLDSLARGKRTRAGSCLNNIRLLFRSERGGWEKYLAFRLDWERAMEIIEAEGIEEIVKRCTV
jgi:glycosyltransferase involved in cell wall biosynthesis